MPNYCFKDLTENDVPPGMVINEGNFSQLHPDTPIMAGRPLTINGGLFINVRQDPAWTINGGNFSQVVRCSNVTPHILSRGFTACPIDCVHSTAHELEIDGVVVETIYTYEESIP